jgi:hypothetical protein
MFRIPSRHKDDARGRVRKGTLSYRNKADEVPLDDDAGTFFRPSSDPQLLLKIGWTFLIILILFFIGWMFPSVGEWMLRQLTIMGGS